MTNSETPALSERRLYMDHHRVARLAAPDPAHAVDVIPASRPDLLPYLPSRHTLVPFGASIVVNVVTGVRLARLDLRIMISPAASVITPMHPIAAPTPMPMMSPLPSAPLPGAHVDSACPGESGVPVSSAKVQPFT